MMPAFICNWRLTPFLADNYHLPGHGFTAVIHKTTVICRRQVINHIVGMDFGTTNSGMAVYDGHAIRVLPLDPANNNPHVARTALYVTNDQRVTFGREAVNGYFEENIGRPVKMKRVWVGEVEVYAEDMYYVTDVYAWVDALSPGRLFLSIKSGLRDPEYQGTVIGRFYYSLENLL